MIYIKRCTCLLMFVFFIVASSITAFCSENIEIYFNKKHITCDVEPFIENSRTLIPIVLANQMGYETVWNGKKRTVTIKNNEKKIVLTIDSNIAIVDGNPTKMDVEARIFQDRTYVPVRFISEYFGYTVKWDGEGKKVYVSNQDVVITDINVSRGDGVLNLKLEANSLIKDVSVFKLESPLRYVVDINCAILDVPQGSIEINSETISRLRYSQYNTDPNSARIVIDANKETIISHKYIDGTFTIIISDDDRAAYLNKIESSENEKSVSFKISANRNLEYTTYKLSNPTRYFVEFEKSIVSIDDFSYSGDIVKKVEIEEDLQMVCFIFYIEGNASQSACSISASGNEYTVKVESRITTKVESQPIVSDKLIVIDPGHGGDEPGSLGYIDDKIVLYEKDVNLKIAMYAYEKLLADGYNVIATRTEDSTVSLIKRAEIANSSDAMMFVSVHNNSFTNNEAQGTLTMYAYDSPKEGQSVTDKEVAAAIQPHILSATGGQDRDLMENAKIYVLAKTDMPSCLVECLFMSNPEDLEKLLDEEYLKKMGEGIALGIKDAVKLFENSEETAEITE